MLTNFRTGQYICLNRGRLDSTEVIFNRNNTIKQSQSVSTRRNLNRLLLPMIVNQEIKCREKSYNLTELCHHICTSNCEKSEFVSKPCYIEQIGTTIDL